MFTKKKDDDDDDDESQNIKVLLRLDHPDLSEYEVFDASVYGEDQLDFTNKLAEEINHANAICGLLVSFTEQVIDTEPASEPAQAAAPAAAATGGAEEIMKYKNLLDAGIITQEEFNMKKKQLLGF